MVLREKKGLSTAAMAGGVIALLVIAGAASYFVGVSNAGTTTSTATSTFTQQAQTITQSITQTSTLTNTQTSTSTFTTTAAPVSFAFVPQPKTGRASNFTRLFNALLPSGVKVRFVNFTTADGVTLGGVLVEPQNSSPATTPAFLAIGGRGANYTGLAYAFAPRLASYGYAFFAINDRNGFYDGFDTSFTDIGAGFSVLKSLGYANVVLMAHSYGGVQMAAFAATSRDSAIKAFVGVEPSANLAWNVQWTSANVVKDPTLYSKTYADAKNLIAQGKPYATLPETVPYVLAGIRVNMSAICFVTEYSPESIPTTTWIRHVSVPVFIGRVPSDTTVTETFAQWNLGNATAPGSQVPVANYVIVPDPTGKAGHTLAVVSVQLAYADAIHTWLQAQKIGP